MLFPLKDGIVTLEKTIKKGERTLIFPESHVLAFWVPHDAVVSTGLGRGPALALRSSPSHLPSLGLRFFGYKLRGLDYIIYKLPFI